LGKIRKNYEKFIIFMKNRNFNRPWFFLRLILWCFLLHVVNIVEETVKVDRQGRLILPSRVRRSLGLRDGGTVSVRLDGSRVVLEPAFQDLERKVEEWKQTVLRLKTEAFTEPAEESWKWMSREYARSKLGLR